MNALQYDHDNLPPLPFNVYFIDQDGRISPKRIYTVTRKEIDTEASIIQLYVLELDQHVAYDPSRIIPVAEFCVNDIYAKYRKL